MILLFMTLLVTGVIGQWRDIRFDEIGQQDGYMARGVYDMAQDSLGHMYFATEMGLLRYDGTAFDYYLYDPGDTSGIAEGKVNCISIDPNGILWLGMNGVLDRFDPKSGTFLHNSVEFSIDSNSRKRLSISSILDDDDRLWLGGGDYTLHQFYKSTGRMETFIPENQRQTSLGFSAQELQTILPEVVKTHDWKIISEATPDQYQYLRNDKLGVMYSQIIPVTVKAIQEQQTQIEELKKAVEELKKQNELLLQLVSKK